MQIVFILWRLSPDILQVRSLVLSCGLAKSSFVYQVLIHRPAKPAKGKSTRTNGLPVSAVLTTLCRVARTNGAQGMLTAQAPIAG